MMIKIFKAILAVLFIGLLSPSIAQYECGEYHKFNCLRSSDKRFDVNGQSRSAMIKVGTPTEMNIIAYGGQDYRITLCSDKKILGEYVVFRLIEKVREPKQVVVATTDTIPVLNEWGEQTGEVRTEKRTETKTLFEDVRKVLYDNTEYEMAQEVEFSMASTKRLIVEITAPGSDTSTRKRSSSEVDIGCLGVLIEHMASPGLGF